MSGKMSLGFQYRHCARFPNLKIPKNFPVTSFYNPVVCNSQIFHTLKNIEYLMKCPLLTNHSS